MCLEFCCSKSLCWSHPSQTEERLNPQIPGLVVYSWTYCVETGTTVSSPSINFILPLNTYQKTFYPIPSDLCLVMVTALLQERILDVESQKRTVLAFSPTTRKDFRCGPVLCPCSVGPAELYSPHWPPLCSTRKPRCLIWGFCVWFKHWYFVGSHSKTCPKQISSLFSSRILH